MSELIALFWIKMNIRYDEVAIREITLIISKVIGDQKNEARCYLTLGKRPKKRHLGKCELGHGSQVVAASCRSNEESLAA